MAKLWYLCGAVLFLFSGCDTRTDQRITRLEREDQDLKAEASKNRIVAEYDLQAKCSKDAKLWFNENFGREKNALYLDEMNHYNKSRNKCFVYVQYHYRSGENNSWTDHTTLWDVYENTRYGEFIETHTTTVKPTFEIKKEIENCELFDKKCVTKDEFDALVRPYLVN